MFWRRYRWRREWLPSDVPLIRGRISQLFIITVFAAIAAQAWNYDSEEVHLELTEADLQEDNVINNSSKIPGSRSKKAADCAELFEAGYRTSGLYEIKPKNRIITCDSIKVYCDMETNGGGWTVIQRRGDFGRAKDFFYKNWDEYKKGFGRLTEDFWLGNDKIYALTNQNEYTARFDLQDVEGEKVYSEYDTFYVDNEASKYKLHIGEYKGNAGDSMKVHNNRFFTTKDRKNDDHVYNCAVNFKGGWWYAAINSCHNANPNGLYVKHVNRSSWEDVIWSTWKGFDESLEFTEIKIRPRDFEDYN